MADNILIKDGAGSNKTMRTTDNGGVHTPHHALAAGTEIVGKVGIDQTTPGTTNGVQVNAALPAGTNLIGKVSIDQVTANANEVVTKSGSVTNATLQAGSAIVGKFGIDQTTPGTTNKVSTDTTRGSGTVDASTQRVVLATDVALPAGTNLLGAAKIHGQRNTDGVVAEAVSFILDSNSRPVQRVVDAAPWNPPATACTLYHVTLTSADTEYSQALPAACRHVSVRIMDGADTDTFRLAWVTGKVATPTAPYLKFSQAEEYVTPSTNINIASGTIYIASSAASKTAIIEAWA
jgi:hypothetical protein